ncbi:hypothetical protein FQN57_004214 [Myotisia sp. PD_48]|nr:hypothetical protein FQN57_004214 [Myotisia sp. PD_48]
MTLRDALQRVLAALIPLSIASLCYLYLYPLFHGCAFPHPAATNKAPNFFPPYTSDAFLDTVWAHTGLPHQRPNSSAPFRLLVLADPQIEGDSSLPEPGHGFIPSLKEHWNKIKDAREGTVGSFISVIGASLRDVFLSELPLLVQASRKRLDLLGNDFYLAHIYRTLSWWSRPTHTTVLGDLVGSQWVLDDEFERRSWRYWNRVFRGGVRVDNDITVTGSDDPAKHERGEFKADLGTDDWSQRIINIAGNHDIGYAGDISRARMERFDRAFGRPNWDVRFELPGYNRSDISSSGSGSGSPPSIHLIVLNTLSIDGPALDSSIQTETYQYVNDVIRRRLRPVEDRTTFTLLLTHLPLHKQEGVCTDPPYFSYNDGDDQDNGNEPRFTNGGLREQNHLSEYFSRIGLLQGIFGMTGDAKAPSQGKGRNGLVLTGHDHTGCDVIHFVDRNGTQVNDDPASSWSWNATRYDPKAFNHTKADPAIREVTLRSMMGEYGGNAGLLSVWYDANQATPEWKYELALCPLGVQHIWWGIHITTIVTSAIALLWGILRVTTEKPVTEKSAAPRDKKQPSLVKGTKVSGT